MGRVQSALEWPGKLQRGVSAVAQTQEQAADEIVGGSGTRQGQEDVLGNAVSHDFIFSGFTKTCCQRYRL